MTLTPSPQQSAELTVFQLLRGPHGPAWRIGAAIIIAGAAWLGGLAFLAQYRETEVWALFAPLGAPLTVFLACAAFTAVTCVAGLVVRAWGVAALGAAATAYLAGFYLSGFLYVAYPPDFDIPLAGLDDAIDFTISRLWYLIPSVLALGAAALVFRGGPRVELGLGDWRVRARDANAKEEMKPYYRRFLGFVIVAFILALILQAGVGFEPVTSGRLFALAPVILLCAAVNATVEEAIYRGFLQPAYMRVAGVGAGIWIGALHFGMAHWGMSVGVLAALPISLLIGVGAVFWGKAAYETRGLSWPIAAHFLIDVAVMSAYFV